MQYLGYTYLKLTECPEFLFIKSGNPIYVEIYIFPNVLVLYLQV